MTYSQTTGVLALADGTRLCVAYAGQGAGKNNPAWQSVQNTGPLPQGVYHLGTLSTLPHLGPCIPLTPDPANHMRGRSGFLIHLDNPTRVGDSSDGCIVVPSLAVLTQIAGSGDTLLIVNA